FIIKSKKSIDSLLFSYVGYETLIFHIKNEMYNKPVIIQMEKKAVTLSEVTIFPGINPAHRIIEQTIANKDINNPEKMSSFKYTSYNKIYFTIDFGKETTEEQSKTGIKFKLLDENTTAADSGKQNASDTSAEARLRKFFDEQHLMLIESVSEREFLYPDMNNETVIASRISGFQNPAFTLLATQMQSFSFYPEFITIYEKRYLNPISNGSINKYFFLLEDTLFTERGDTVFIISFRPGRGKNFDGLKGILHINSDKYAVQSVIAQPFEEQKISVKIQQNYELIDNEQWFPVQLNTDIIFNNLIVGAATGRSTSKGVKVIGIGKSYLTNIILNPELRRREFDNIELELDKNATQKPEEYWNKFRTDSLTGKDKSTYKVIDSLGKAEKLDTKLKGLEILLTGAVPVKFISLPLDKLLAYNEYEGMRAGLGIETNQRFSGIIQLGGYGAWGFRDKDYKYGAYAGIILHKRAELKISGLYRKDVIEAAGYEFLEDKSLTSSDLYRKIMLENMDKILQKKLAVSFRWLRYIKTQLYIVQSFHETTSGYRYKYSENNVDVFRDDFIFTEAGVNLKFLYKEKFAETLSWKYTLGSDYPVLWVNIDKSIPFAGDEFQYTRVVTKISGKIITKSLGTTALQVTAGYLAGQAPYVKLFNGYGSYQKYTVEADNSFNTMRMNEFLSDRFINIYFKHDFGKLLFKTKKFQPEFALLNHIGFGSLEQREVHTGYPFTTLEKGYYEAGILFNCLLRESFIGYGIGVFYRYGPYSFSYPEQNFSIKLSVTFSI
ncbi:MAG: hypothetical protein HY738_06435, partial [Bacteroidia bacterium]|nr:hypothetical protein [Bacteroidia bacterium]